MRCACGLILVVGLNAGAACTEREGTCAQSDAPVVSVGGPTVDADRDGLDDALEDALARAYLPFLALHPEDACPRSGIVFRARPHPEDAALVSMVYSWLFERDCGSTGHVGDNEAFGATIDPRAPPPAGLVAIVAVGHQATPCERTTTCGVCDGLAACERVDGRVVLFSSRDKHAGSVSRAWGCGAGSCLDTCELPVTAADVPLVNVGEPGAPLVRDLSRDGFITAANGWREETLLGFDPWGDGEFGTAGSVRGDLEDDTFIAPACRCAL